MRRLILTAFLLCSLPVCFLKADADQTVRRTVLRIENLPPDSTVQVQVSDLSTGSFQMIPAESGKIVIETDSSRDFLISLKDLPAGLMPSDEILLTSAKPQNTDVSIALQPFEVRIFQMIEGTDILTEGGIMELIDEEDEAVFEFELNKEGEVRRTGEDEQDEFMEFHAGDILIAHLQNPSEGYSSCGDQVILIPEYQNCIDEPFVFRTYISQNDPDSDPHPPQPSGTVFYDPPLPAVQILYEEQVIPQTETKEDAVSVPETEKPVQTAAVYSYPVYVPQSREQTESQILPEKAGFLIRLTDENRQALSGCEIAVFDEDGNEVDRWMADGKDHLVQNESVQAGRVYTIRQLSRIEGYEMSSVPIAHTASEKKNSQYPVISIIDRRIEKETETAPQKKIEKASGWLAAAAAAAAAGAAVTAMIAFMLKKH